MMSSGRTSTIPVSAGLIVAAVAAGGPLAAPAPADGGPENAVLIIDPTDRESLLVGNYYRDARNIPDRNVLFLESSATDFPAFNQFNVPAVKGSLVLQGIESHIDYVILPPDGTYRLPAGGLVSDSCFAVDHFSSSGAYTLTFIADEVLAGVPVTLPNHYHTTTTTALAFDGAGTWLNGSPNASGNARRYLIGASLGYTGIRGNSIPEILDNIDRSVAADGTRPVGTFYYMQTTDEARSGPRHDFFPAAVQSITNLGGSAQHLMDVLPIGQHDCLGIMTGWASPDIVGADMTILPGAFGDHLTSWAATFDIGSQTKVSKWIVKGASGSCGAVEEPCNYPGKFPTANVHVFYFQGLTLGEAYFRSMQYAPFQSLLYGDPLTRPFAYIPTVDVPDAPAAPVSGTLVLTPDAGTAHPSALIDHLDLLIDGVPHDSIAAGGAFSIDTTTLPDGHHELRVLAYDNTSIRSVGRWIGSMEVDNGGRKVLAGVNNSTGNLTTAYQFSIVPFAGPVDEVRIVHGSRVVGATSINGGSITVHGWQLGAGPVRVHAEAVYPDRSIVRSAPIALDITDTTTAGVGPAAPVAFSYFKKILRDQPGLVELPASFDTDFASASYTVLSPPAQATIQPGPAGPFRLLVPDAGASGFDQMTFEVTTPGGTSNVATVTLLYGGAPVNDLCAAAPLIQDGQHPFDTIDAATDGFAEAGECADFGQDIWYKYLATCAGLVTVDVCDADYDSALGVYAACPTGPDQAIGCTNDDCGEQSRLSFETPGPGLYRIRVGGAGGQTGLGTLTITCDPCPADCALGAGDGTVDIQDLLALLGEWGTGGGPCDFAGGLPAGGDGLVDIQDLLALLADWGACP